MTITKQQKGACDYKFKEDILNEVINTLIILIDNTMPM